MQRRRASAALGNYADNFSRLAYPQVKTGLGKVPSDL